MIWLVEPPNRGKGDVCIVCQKKFKKWGDIGNILRHGVCKKCAMELLFDEDKE